MICVIDPMNSSLNINRVPWILAGTLSNLTSYVSCKILKKIISLDDLQPHFYQELDFSPSSNIALRAHQKILKDLEIQLFWNSSSGLGLGW